MERPGEKGPQGWGTGSTGRAGASQAEQDLSRGLAGGQPCGPLCFGLVSSSRNGEEMKHHVHPLHRALQALVHLPTGPPTETGKPREQTGSKWQDQLQLVVKV